MTQEEQNAALAEAVAYALANDSVDDSFEEWLAETLGWDPGQAEAWLSAHGALIREGAENLRACLTDWVELVADEGRSPAR